MALFAPEHLDAVVAIGVAKKTGGANWVATGFLFGNFIKMVDEKSANYRVFLVTNRHVFEGLDSVVLRLDAIAPQTAPSPVNPVSQAREP